MNKPKLKLIKGRKLKLKLRHKGKLAPKPVLEFIEEIEIKEPWFPY